MLPAKSKVLKVLAGEKWMDIPLKRNKHQKKYAVSNHGRVASYSDSLKSGSILKTRLTQGYPSITLKNQGKNLNFYIHRLVAQLFLKKSSKQTFVIHLDHKKENNRYKNLKWVTWGDQIEHAKKDPAVIHRQRPTEGLKLNAEKVRRIKKKLAQKNPPTLKKLAEQFKVSDMQIYRIKSGENWSHIK
jgi:hypothetical protein